MGKQKRTCVQKMWAKANTGVCLIAHNGLQYETAKLPLKNEKK